MSKHPHPPARTGRRIAVAGAAALTSALVLAAPAAAHAEVEADTPQALAENVTLSFVSEAESDSAGFRELRVVLPDGIAPDDVSLAGAPKGWRLKATADGYTVGGPALKPGVNAEHKIKVDRLPDAKQIAFKTVETYSDGEVSRWIELPRGGDEPEQPAPVLKLKAAAPDAKPASPSPTSSPAPDETSSATADSAAEQDATSAAEKTTGESDGVSSGVLIGAIVAVLLVLAGGAWWLIRRRASASQG
ncbi:YcnI family protein [Streptomyces sp. NBS 14/10]|uniref:YcnI family protein n=1 Tax=Streptomyces sp. NBS 14/10 TaxID=1945643 RepID=UPI00211B5351|nr:YcnI family protein [Streptomyces sp. NBS 14/10]KAK1177078.1 YcnI family protein [Streptomyces sp. NBS 14/10]